MFKFCRKFDEDENAYVGGTTVCECLATCCTRRKVVDHPPEVVQEEIVIQEDEAIEDEYDDMEKAK